MVSLKLRFCFVGGEGVKSSPGEEAIPLLMGPCVLLGGPKVDDRELFCLGVAVTVESVVYRLSGGAGGMLDGPLCLGRNPLGGREEKDVRGECGVAILLIEQNSSPGVFHVSGSLSWLGKVGDLERVQATDPCWPGSGTGGAHTWVSVAGGGGCLACQKGHGFAK